VLKPCEVCITQAKCITQYIPPSYYQVYTLQIKWSSVTGPAVTTVDRRYTHFEELHDLLLQENHTCIMPALPPRTAVFKSISKADDPLIEQRKLDFIFYLSELFKMPAAVA
jgi:hypothetical protein